MSESLQLSILLGLAIGTVAGLIVGEALIWYTDRREARKHLRQNKVAGGEPTKPW